MFSKGFVVSELPAVFSAELTGVAFLHQGPPPPTENTT